MKATARHARIRTWTSVLACVLAAVCAGGHATGQDLGPQVRSALEKLPHPAGAGDFQSAPALNCLNQGKTSICWSFATSSFVESEMARLKLDSVRLSVLYPVYCAYLEKTRRFVQTRGTSRFSPGDLFTGVPELWLQYGAMPAAAYDKFDPARELDQHPLYDELERLTQEVKRSGKWDEKKVLARAKRILNRHLGEPPAGFVYEGKRFTPQSFLKEIVRLPWRDYLMVTSFEYAPFNTFTALEVPDNWRRNTNFFNVPLPVFYDALKGAVQKGFTVAASVDISEPAYKTTGLYCFIPEFDLPASGVGQDAREVRFADGATTDDHAVHVIGWNTFGGEDWFLAKDSWKTAWRDGHHGELFLHGSYVKLKLLAFLVAREGVPQLSELAPKH
jgi:bleomycin hydrolase